MADGGFVEAWRRSPAGPSMKLAAIALRNLARNRRRTLISLLVTAAGACALVVTAGFIRFSFGGLAQAIIRGGLGHLEVVPSELANLSLPERSGLPTLAGFEDLRRVIEKTPGVRAAGAAIHLAGVVSKGDRSAPFLGAAVEPDRERRMDLELKLRAGANLPEEAPADGSDAVVLGLGLARALDARRRRRGHDPRSDPERQPERGGHEGLGPLHHGTPGNRRTHAQAASGERPTTAGDDQRFLDLRSARGHGADRAASAIVFNTSSRTSDHR